MPQKKQANSFVDARQLEAFHRSVCSVLNDSIRHDVVMKSTMDGWKSSMASTDTFVTFQVYPKLELLHETAENDLGHRCPVLPFSESSNAFPTWIFCRDEWNKCGADEYDLVSFSLCFFGGAGAKKTQLLRAEWANPKQQGSLAAQPHWHIDPNLLDLDFWNGSPTSVADVESPSVSLQELPMQGSPEDRPAFWSLQKLHLGMGGWHHAANNPNCWQHPLDFAEGKELLRWLSKTLGYVATEIGKATASN